LSMDFSEYLWMWSIVVGLIPSSDDVELSVKHRLEAVGSCLDSQLAHLEISKNW
jgi:hypothetical protein